MKNLSYYKNLITSQYQGKPKLDKWLTVLLQPLVDIGNCADLMYVAFDIDTCIGVQQDAIGAILGIPRILPYQPASGNARLSDDDYRIVLKAKIIKNHWDGRIVTIERLWNSLFKENYIIVIDNQNMSINVAIVGSFSVVIEEMLTKGLLVPCPEGVKLNLGIEEGGSGLIDPPAFGYDEQDATISGYNVGYWRL